ncbi:MAG: class I SAM-dependent methyltransferase [Candidatus Methanomethylicaceae archaeon]
MKFTGERLVPGIPRLENMILEELGRLNFIRPYFTDKIVLDTGCGAGYGAHFMAEGGACWVLGIDISVQAIQYAANKYVCNNLSFCVMDCTQLGLGDQIFDVVVALELIEHLSQPAQFLSEVVRVLKPEGVFFLSTPNRKVSSTPSGKASWPFHKQEFAVDELCELLRVYFREVQVWGSYVAAYEHHPLRRITKSPLSLVKHALPPKIRAFISSSVRYWIKPKPNLEDVVFSTEEVCKAPTLVALCSNKQL